MTTALAILLILIGVEALVLILFPQQVRRMIQDTPPGALRVIGIVEAVLVTVLILLAMDIL